HTIPIISLVNPLEDRLGQWPFELSQLQLVPPSSSPLWQLCPPSSLLHTVPLLTVTLVYPFLLRHLPLTSQQTVCKLFLSSAGFCCSSQYVLTASATASS
ncbi:hypothetical protein PAXRUDRAFT_793986, partial [Paxillus rubicundulus Ve08.2h10]